MNDMSEFDDPKRMVERGYDQVADKYARLEEGTEWARMRWLKKVLDRLAPGSSVLDLGCGSGDPADIEIAKAHKVTGVDISETQINLARQNIPAGDFLHRDIGSVEFTADSFDAVVSFYTLDHVPRAEHKTILRSIHKWLRARGLLLFSIEAGEHDDETGEWLGVPMFISCFDPETTKTLVNEAGFEILETAIESRRAQGNDVPFLWVFAQKQ
jgi:cyclopropane fatty-acyl-phospholipid synthase-like methyltransferase